MPYLFEQMREGQNALKCVMCDNNSMHHPAPLASVACYEQTDVIIIIRLGNWPGLAGSCNF